MESRVGVFAMLVIAGVLGCSDDGATGGDGGDGVDPPPGLTTGGGGSLTGVADGDTVADGDSDGPAGPTSGGEVTGTGPGDGSGATDGDSDSEADSDSDSGDPLPEPGAMCAGYATRYWDCCKPHCGWSGNVNEGVDTLASCNQANAPLGDLDTPSSCSQPGPDSAHTCYSLAPWAVNETVAYGFAAIPSEGDICGRCYRLDFTGVSYNAGEDAGSAALAGKSMVVQAVNIGYDVAGGQFDILIPGGGVGAFDACSSQWGVDSGQLGATYGGWLTSCKQEVGGDHEALKACVTARCDSVFTDAGRSDLRDACDWFVDWFEVADNPALTWGEVECPGPLVAVSGMDRSALGDVQTCDGSGGGARCPGGCDCSWTEGGANCGADDGSCCWDVCCG